MNRRILAKKPKRIEAMSTEYPSVHRSVAYAKKIRARLIAQLGGKCFRCGQEDPDKLEFDHIFGRDYDPRTLSYSARLKRYERESELGLLRLACGDCNKAVRVANDNGQWVRTEHADQVERTDDIPF